MLGGMQIPKSTLHEQCDRTTWPLEKTGLGAFLGRPAAFRRFLNPAPNTARRSSHLTGDIEGRRRYLRLFSLEPATETGLPCIAMYCDRSLWDSLEPTEQSLRAPTQGEELTGKLAPNPTIRMRCWPSYY